MAPQATPDRTLDVRSYFDPVECRSLKYVKHELAGTRPAADAGSAGERVSEPRDPGVVRLSSATRCSTSGGRAIWSA